jgi:hypothetical protein
MYTHKAHNSHISGLVVEGLRIVGGPATLLKGNTKNLSSSSHIDSPMTGDEIVAVDGLSPLLLLLLFPLLFLLFFLVLLVLFRHFLFLFLSLSINVCVCVCVRAPLFLPLFR